MEYLRTMKFDEIGRWLTNEEKNLANVRGEI